MGMNFSPMYQPVSTKTIKADGDLNVNPYDLLATDVKCDTVEADEFVGGVGNFSSSISNAYTINAVIDNEGVAVPSVSGSTITIADNGPRYTLPAPVFPKYAGLFILGSLVGENVPNYQVSIKPLTSASFVIHGNTDISTGSIAGNTTKTFDTGISILDDINISVSTPQSVGSGATAYLSIPEFYVRPAQ